MPVAVADREALTSERVLAERRRSAWRFVTCTWLASRLLFLIAGALGAHFLSHAPTGYPAEPPGTFNYWAHWDGAWYSSIAKVGSFGTPWPSSALFRPSYPLVLRLGIS